MPTLIEILAPIHEAYTEFQERERVHDPLAGDAPLIEDDIVRFARDNTTVSALMQDYGGWPDKIGNIQNHLRGMGMEDMELLSMSNSSAMIVANTDRTEVARIRLSEEIHDPLSMDIDLGDFPDLSDEDSPVIIGEIEVHFPAGTPVITVTETRETAKYTIELLPFVKTLDAAIREGDVTPEDISSQLENLVFTLLRSGIYMWDHKLDGFGVDSNGTVLILDKGSFCPTDLAECPDDPRYTQKERLDTEYNVGKLKREMEEIARQSGVDFDADQGKGQSGWSR